RDEADKRPLALPAAQRLGIRFPEVDQLLERRRRDEDRLAHLRPLDDRQQPAPQEIAVAAALGEGEELLEREERSAQREEARGREIGTMVRTGGIVGRAGTIRQAATTTASRRG